jgi:hypothetical protein
LANKFIDQKITTAKEKRIGEREVSTQEGERRSERKKGIEERQERRKESTARWKKRKKARNQPG